MASAIICKPSCCAKGCAPLDMVISGQRPRDVLEQAVRAVAANTLGGYMAEQIGDDYKEGLIDTVTHQVLHAANGAIIGGILGGEDGIIPGMIGSTVVELLPKIMDLDVRDIYRRLEAGEDANALKRDLLRLTDMGRLGGAAINAWLEEDVTTSIQAATLTSENNVIPAIAWVAAKLTWELYLLYFPDEVEAAQETICQYIADKTGLPIDKVRTVGNLVMNASSFVRGGRYVAKQAGRYMARKSIAKPKEQKDHKDDHSLKALPVPTDQPTDHSSSSPTHVDVTQKNTITIEYKEGMDVRDFDRKTKALQDLAERGKLVKTQPVRDENLTAKYRKNILDAARNKFKESNPTKYEQLKLKIENMDADHLHELQLGGIDHKGMLTMLEKKVNRSIGSQVRHQMKDLPMGAKIDKIDIKGPNQ